MQLLNLHWPLVDIIMNKLIISRPRQYTNQTC